MTDPETRWKIALDRFRGLPLDILSREKWDLEQKGADLDRRLLKNRLRYWTIGTTILAGYILLGFVAVQLLLLHLGVPQLVATTGGLAWFVFLSYAPISFVKPWIDPIDNEHEALKDSIRANAERLNLAQQVFKEKVKASLRHTALVVVFYNEHGDLLHDRPLSGRSGDQEVLHGSFCRHLDY